MPFRDPQKQMEYWRKYHSSPERKLKRAVAEKKKRNANPDEWKRKNRERMKRWRKSNPKKAKEAQDRQYLNNRDGRINSMRKYQKTQKAKETQKRWRKDNRKKVIESVNNWKAKNPDKVREYEKRTKRDPVKAKERARKYRQKYPDRARERRQRWRKRNRDRERVYRHTRRARIIGAAGRFTKEQVIGRFSLWGGLCSYCLYRPAVAMDHVIPISRGGTNWPANLRPACKRCNSSKHNKLLSEWKRA